MAVFIGLLLALALMVVLARPVLRREVQASGDISSPDFLEVSRRQQQIYDDIKSLILDHELGNVPPREYRERLETYRLQAANALREQEQLRQTLSGQEEDLEDQALELRRSWGAVKRVNPCEWCGGEVDALAALCPRCELPLDGEPSVEEEASWVEQ